jgi:hypothetical protein
MLVPCLSLKNRQPRAAKHLPHRRPARSHPPRIESLEERCLLTGDACLLWNSYMLQAQANDYTPSIVATPDQPGPTNTARAFAIISAGVYDAVNSIDPLYTPYLTLVPNAQGASIDAAVGTAAHDTMVALFPHQQAAIDDELTAFLAGIPDGRAKGLGIQVGSITAANILAARANDGSNNTQSYVPLPYPGYHQVDPLHPNQGFLSPQWGEVRPFVLDSSNQFRADDVGLDPQARLDFLNSSEYTVAYNEVMAYGAKDSTIRTPDETQIGIFWAYDGSPELGVPPREDNQVAAVIGQVKGNTEVQNARMFALVNLAMGDGSIAAWESKYFYSFWRPIVAIRNADSTGNPYTPEDPDWQPLGAQCSNGCGNVTNFTPSFPSYVSGHATFASATFQALRDFYGTDAISFSFQSDEYNGMTTDDTGAVRPAVTRNYTSMSQAELEVHDSRIYLGIHWRFDQDQGLLIGRSVGDWTFQHALRPLRAQDPVPASALTSTPVTDGGLASPGAPTPDSTSPAVQPQAAMVSGDPTATASQPAAAGDTGTVATTQPAASPTLDAVLGSPDSLRTGLS